VYQALVAASLLIAAYRDVKTREVEDLVWIPAAVGVSLGILFSGQWLLAVVKVGLVGLIAVAATWYGVLGEADLFAFVVIGADPAAISLTFALGASAIILAAHVGYLYYKGEIGRRLEVPASVFRRELKWLPKAVISDGVRTEVGRDVNKAREEALMKATDSSMIEVKYGVPTVAYLGVGYFAFLVYTLLFNFQGFLSVP
jgi:hypothetical protein